jgi:hypothetical protein
MSDTSTSTATGDNASTGIQAALRDVRWLSGLIWLGLLAALLVTSSYGITAFTQGSIATRYFPANGLGDPDAKGRIAIAGLVASGLAAAAIVMAWFQFVRATRALIVAYGPEDGDPATSLVAAEWISDETPEGRSARTRIPVGDALLYIGASWAVLIVMPAFLNAVASFGGSSGR